MSRLAKLLSHYNEGTSIGKVLRAPFRFVPSGSALPVLFGINKGLKWIVGSSARQCWLGTYEAEKQSIIQSLVKPGMTVFDVGANAGFFSIGFSRLVGFSGEIWAFEPLANQVDFLLKHLKLNKLENVQVIQSALADKSGFVRFEVCSNGFMGSLGGNSHYHVPVASIDELIISGTVPIPNVIKLDVEGAEASVLRGARQCLKNDRPLLLIACHGKEQRQQCLELLQSNKYQIYYLDGKKHEGSQLLGDEIYALPEDC